jgi:hypothetical protein
LEATTCAKRPASAPPRRDARISRNSSAAWPSADGKQTELLRFHGDAQNKTLAVFGRDGSPIHRYTMRQAISIELPVTNPAMNGVAAHAQLARQRALARPALEIVPEKHSRLPSEHRASARVGEGTLSHAPASLGG